MGIDGIRFHPRYQQNLGTFREVWLFQNFFWLKKCPPLVKSCFENTMGNNFFLLFLNTDQNAPKKIQNCNYIVLFKKSAFRNNFGVREVLELKKLSRRFPKSKIIFKADFLKSTL